MASPVVLDRTFAPFPLIKDICPTGFMLYKAVLQSVRIVLGVDTCTPKVIYTFGVLIIFDADVSTLLHKHSFCAHRPEGHLSRLPCWTDFKNEVCIRIYFFSLFPTHDDLAVSEGFTCFSIPSYQTAPPKSENHFRR